MAENFPDARDAYVYQVGGLNMQKKKNTSYFDQWQSLYPLRRI